MSPGVPHGLVEPCRGSSTRLRTSRHALKGVRVLEGAKQCLSSLGVIFTPIRADAQGVLRGKCGQGEGGVVKTVSPLCLRFGKQIGEDGCELALMACQLENGNNRLYPFICG